MSSFAWLDFSESDREKALNVIDLFREQGTVDEIGVGTVRDAIADRLFPGTSTIMTRARYYLFIPWIYARHEQKKTASNEISQAARKDEIALMRIPDHSVHPFRLNPSTDSGRIRPPIPDQFVHLFRRNSSRAEGESVR